MVLDYCPCDVNVFSDLFMEYNKIKNIPVSEQEEMFLNLLDNRFCKYILKKGKYKGKMYLRKFSKYSDCKEIYCFEHRYLEKKCNHENCNLKCKKSYNLCNKHLKLKNKYKTSILNINEEYSIFSENGMILDIYSIKIIDIKNIPCKNMEKKNFKLIEYNIDRKLNEKNIQNINVDTFYYVKDIINIENNLCNKNKYINNNNKINTYDNIYENKYKLEFYLSNIYYILKKENSITFIKSFILEILNIISNNMNFNINFNYLDLVDFNVNIYRTKIETIHEKKKIVNYGHYNLDYFNNSDNSFLKKIIIKDIYNTYGYKDLKMITYELNNKFNKNNKMEIKEKKHDMNLWKNWNIKNEYPKSNPDGSIDWKIKWPL